MPMTNELPLRIDYQIYRNEDFLQTFYVYKYSVDIQSAVYSSGSGLTTITTKTPHFLVNGSKVLLVVDSSTLSYITPTLATPVTDLTFTVSGRIDLPPTAEKAQVSVPVDFSNSTFVGGIYNYLTQERDISVNATLKATAGSGLLTITGTTKNLDKVDIGDRIKFGAMTTYTPILDISPVRITSDPALLSYGLTCDNTFFEVVVLVDAAAITATITTNSFYVKHTEVIPSAGTLSKPIAASGNLPWGELTVKIESTELATLQGSYPLQVLRSIGGNEEMILAGTAEIV